MFNTCEKTCLIVVTGSDKLFSPFLSNEFCSLLLIAFIYKSVKYFAPSISPLSLAFLAICANGSLTKIYIASCLALNNIDSDFNSIALYVDTNSKVSIDVS